MSYTTVSDLERIIHGRQGWPTYFYLGYRLRKVPGSYLGPETGYPDWIVSWNYLDLPGEFQDNALNLATTA
jgi:hypothetical protein